MTTVSPQFKEAISAKMKALEESLLGIGYRPRDDYVCWFITLNTRVKKYEEFMTAKRLIEKKIRSRQLITCAFQYSFEYFTKGSNHFHTHICLFKKKSEKRLGKKSFIKHFFIPKIMDNIASVDCRPSKTDKILNNRFKYVSGKKKDQTFIDRDRELLSNFTIKPINRFTINPSSFQKLNRWLNTNTN